MKKSTRISLYVLLVLGAGILLYQLLPIHKNGSTVEQTYAEGTLQGTVKNSSYKYLLVHLFEQDSVIEIKGHNSIRYQNLMVFDTINIVDGHFSYKYKLKEPYVYPRTFFLSDDSGHCEYVAFRNPYFPRPVRYDAICLDRGATITLTIDGLNPLNSTVKGSPKTDALYKRDAEAEAEAKAKRAKDEMIQKKKDAEQQIKHMEDSIKNISKPLDSAMLQSNGKNFMKIYLKPKTKK